MAMCALVLALALIILHAVNATGASYPVARHELVIVMPTDEEHWPLVAATRVVREVSTWDH
jgi:hypothetical protein